jgi:hypothetical protein
VDGRERLTGNAFGIAWTPRATASLRAGYGLDARRFDDLASLDRLSSVCQPVS